MRDKAKNGPTIERASPSKIPPRSKIAKRIGEQSPKYQEVNQKENRNVHEEEQDRTAPVEMVTQETGMAAQENL